MGLVKNQLKSGFTIREQENVKNSIGEVVTQMITIFLQRKNVKRRVAKEVLFRICLRETSSWLPITNHGIILYSILPYFHSVKLRDAKRKAYYVALDGTMIMEPVAKD